MLHLLTDEHKQKVVAEYRKRIGVIVSAGVIGLALVSGKVDVGLVDHSGHWSSSSFVKVMRSTVTSMRWKIRATRRRCRTSIAIHHATNTPIATPTPAQSDPVTT